MATLPRTTDLLVSFPNHCYGLETARASKIYLASFPDSHTPEREIEIVQAWRAWYFLSREKRQR